MTVKSKRGRRRYLVFTVPESASRESMIRSICAPDEIEECTGAVRAAEPSAELVTVSGTLKTLRDRYPVLRRNAPPKPSRAPKPKA